MTMYVLAPIPRPLEAQFWHEKETEGEEAQPRCTKIVKIGWQMSRHR
jgi:hypothetical protein